MTALFPYLILLILLVRAATLPGYMDGITFYLTPQWERLADIRVWADACTQIFFSLGVTWGVMITLASYNKFNNNVYRDAIMVAIGNCCTSVFAGFVIFGIIGFMAHELGKPVKDVVTEGRNILLGNILTKHFSPRPRSRFYRLPRGRTEDAALSTLELPLLPDASLPRVRDSVLHHGDRDHHPTGPVPPAQGRQQEVGDALRLLLHVPGWPPHGH